MLQSLLSSSASLSSSPVTHAIFHYSLKIRIQSLTLFPDCVLDETRKLKDLEASCSLGDSNQTVTASLLDKSSPQAVITWNKDRNTLFWSFSDEEWKKLKASTQRAKIVIKFADRTTSSMRTLGWTMIDLKSLIV